MDEKNKAALIGGVILGILSVIPVLNRCCCLWAIGGGIFAAYLYFGKSSTAATPGDGAMLGLRAGIVGAVIELILSVPIALIAGAANYQNMVQQLRQQHINIPPAVAGLGTMGLVLVGSVIAAVILILLAMLGGLLGAVIFGKKGAAPPYQQPPPPPNYGGMR